MAFLTRLSTHVTDWATVWLTHQTMNIWKTERLTDRLKNLRLPYALVDKV